MGQRYQCDINATIPGSVIYLSTLMKYRYSYNIKDQSGKEEVINCQSYKKLLKQLNSKYKEGEVIQINYTNKKDHNLLKYVKIKRVE